MKKSFRPISAIYRQASRIDCTIESLNIREDYRNPTSRYASSSSFTMARMERSGLGTEDIAYAFSLPVEEVESAIQFTRSYQRQRPNSYKDLMEGASGRVFELPTVDNIRNGPFYDDDLPF